jgi:hypothetical protein
MSYVNGALAEIEDLKAILNDDLASDLREELI